MSSSHRKQRTHSPCYRLALDLGSTSLGWAMLRLKENKKTKKLEPTAIIKAGVRIFNNGRKPARKGEIGASLAVNRREKRQMRRRRDRLLHRKAQVMKMLKKFDFFPVDTAPNANEILRAWETLKVEELDRLNLKHLALPEASKESKNPNEKYRFTPYELRARGLDEKLQPGEFARAIFHLAQRRGFKSNRKTDTNSNENSVIKVAIGALTEKMETENCRTVGEWLWKRLQRHEIVRSKPNPRKDGSIKDYPFYIERSMVENEFDELWKRQKELWKNEKYSELFSGEAYAAIKDAIFYQRHLLPVKPGRCTFLPNEERAPLSLPSQQQFRIYSEVNHLRCLGEDLEQLPLTLGQRDIVVALLEHKLATAKNTTPTVSFSAIRKALEIPEVIQFNLQDNKRSDLKCNATSAVLAKPEYFGDIWHQWSVRIQDAIVLRILNQPTEAQLIKHLIKFCNIDEQHAQNIAKVKDQLQAGYGSLSRKALYRILPKLKETVQTYDKATKAAGFNHSALPFSFEESDVDCWIDEETGEIFSQTAYDKKSQKEKEELTPQFKYLPYYGKPLQRYVGFGTNNVSDPDEKRFGKIANPTVHIGLNQVRVVVNVIRTDFSVGFQNG
jgi:CRISPR-associated endonuclease Csn1